MPNPPVMDLLDSPQFTTRIREHMAKWHVPGLAIALTQNHKVVSRAFGYASLSPEKPCTPDTLFDIASSSKSLTAASVGLLVAADAHPGVKWDAKMSHLLPDDFVMSEDSYTNDITVEDILSHRTGLPSHDDSYMSQQAEAPDNARSITRNLRNLDLAAPIRTKWMYCNMMYTVATHLIETVSGSSFSNFLRHNFFDPLSMSSTHLGPAASKAAGLADRIATGHAWVEATNTFTLLDAHDQPEAHGAGSIITSVNDYIKWVRAMMDAEPPISKEIQHDLLKPRILNDPDWDDEQDASMTSWIGYGMGWESRYYRGVRIVAHDGLYHGFGSTHFFAPARNFGAVILGNADSMDQLGLILQAELTDVLLSVPEAERPDWDARASSSEADYEAKIAEENLELRRTLCPRYNGTLEPQKIPLVAYTGQYWNAGYHSLKVEIKNDQLYIHGSDRSNVLIVRFEHVCDQTMYVAHLLDYAGGADSEVAAEFRFQGGEVVKMGIKLEEALEGFIWFDKARDGGGVECNT